MPDDRSHDASVPIALAFAGLPLETPDRSAWPALAARLDARRSPSRWPWALAAAAALALALGLPRGQLEPAPANLASVAAPAPASTASPAGIDALMTESAQLEHLLFSVRDDSVAAASAALLGLELEDRLQQLDAALADPGIAADRRLALWQQRVSLLREYAGVEGTRHWLASEGRSLDGDLVAAF